jgi:hypothetical protein
MDKSFKYYSSLKPKDKVYTIMEAKGSNFKVSPAGTKRIYLYMRLVANASNSIIQVWTEILNGI